MQLAAMPYRLLALDMDGTLVTRDDTIRPTVRDALRRLQGRDVQIVLATGRRYSRVLPHAVDLRLTLPLVTASGALVKQIEAYRTLFRANFTENVIGELLPFILNAGYDPIVYTDSFGLGYDFHLATSNSTSPELNEFLSLNSESIRVDERMIDSPPAGIFAGFAMGTETAMHRLAAAIEERWPSVFYIHVIRSPRYLGYMCEIAPAGVSKWSGVQFVAQKLGIAANEICAVGDDVNDLPMIENAGLGVAMGNAPENVRAAARRVTGTLDNDGLVQVVDWILS
jgi:5-amino-6-(5-phospho-D-ribitylamino)uracil phosphatase